MMSYLGAAETRQSSETLPKIFPLSAITNRVKEILAPACAKTFWVRAEITSGRESGGSFYCDLLEMGPGGKVIAKIRCSIWSEDLRRIRAKFDQQNIEFQLADGTSVVLFCSLQFSSQYGLSLKVVDADPIFALGEMEQRRQEILEGLRRDGLLEVNGRLRVPALPRRIGLITSKGSAAYHDFIQTLKRSGYFFRVLVADALVQGKGTEPAIVRSLNVLQYKDLDLVAVVRGGGSKSDLAWLDNETIARAIAAYRLPVFTGIGHEIDVSVLDHVANRSFKTPTAVAEDLIARCVGGDRYLEKSGERLKTLWQYHYDKDREWVLRAEEGLRNGTRKHLDTARARLRELAMTPMAKVSGRLAKENGYLGEAARRLMREGLSLLSLQQQGLDECGKKLSYRGEILLERGGRDLQIAGNRFQLSRLLQRISREEERLAGRLATVTSYDPEAQLKRGYALLRATGGKLVTSVSEVKPGAPLAAQMKDGNLSLEVKAVERRKTDE